MRSAESISVNDVTVRYNNGHTAIYDVSFELQGGTICALVGVNGSGKSTLFKSIMGLIKPQQGNIALCGLPINRALKQNLVAGDSFGQIFVTDTNRDHLDKILRKIEGDYKLFEVDGGVVSERCNEEEEI